MSQLRDVAITIGGIVLVAICLYFSWEVFYFLVHLAMSY